MVVKLLYGIQTYPYPIVTVSLYGNVIWAGVGVMVAGFMHMNKGTYRNFRACIDTFDI